MRSGWPVLLAALGATAAGCGGAAAGTLPATPPARVARWVGYIRAPAPIDVAVGRPDARPVVAADGRLYLLDGLRVRRFAPGYHSPPGLEAYIAIAAPLHRGCSYGTGSVYAIRLQDGRGITRVRPNGRVSRFAGVSAPGLINGITFDETGGFGHRLLVTINHRSTVTLDAISCTGAVTTITRSAPRVEGGIVVAPRGFGRFGGDLIAPDELTGRIFAITPRGRSFLVAQANTPHGQDFGVESETFLPPDPQAQLVVADRLTRGNPHPGDNVLLRVSAGALLAAGARPSDLIVAGEGGGFTDAVGCSSAGCHVRYVAAGPTRAHLEGHIVVLPAS
jgi:hypothetical protein